MAERAESTDGPQHGSRLPRPRVEVRTDVIAELPAGLIPMPRAVPAIERMPRAAG